MSRDFFGGLKKLIPWPFKKANEYMDTTTGKGMDLVWENKLVQDNADKFFFNSARARRDTTGFAKKQVRQFVWGYAKKKFNGYINKKIDGFLGKQKDFDLGSAIADHIDSLGKKSAVNKNYRIFGVTLPSLGSVVKKIFILAEKIKLVSGVIMMVKKTFVLAHDRTIWAVQNVRPVYALSKKLGQMVYEFDTYCRNSDNKVMQYTHKAIDAVADAYMSAGGAPLKSEAELVKFDGADMPLNYMGVGATDLLYNKNGLKNFTKDQKGRLFYKDQPVLPNFMAAPALKKFDKENTAFTVKTESGIAVTQYRF